MVGLLIIVLYMVSIKWFGETPPHQNAMACRKRHCLGLAMSPWKASLWVEESEQLEATCLRDTTWKIPESFTIQRQPLFQDHPHLCHFQSIPNRFKWGFQVLAAYPANSPENLVHRLPLPASPDGVYPIGYPRPVSNQLWPDHHDQLMHDHALYRALLLNKTISRLITVGWTISWFYWYQWWHCLA